MRFELIIEALKVALIFISISEIALAFMSLWNSHSWIVKSMSSFAILGIFNFILLFIFYMNSEKE